MIRPAALTLALLSISAAKTPEAEAAGVVLALRY